MNNNIIIILFRMNYKGILINLDRRKDRYSNFKNQVQFIKSVQIERLSAVDARTLEITPELDARINKGNNRNGYCFKTIVACCLSHLEVYKKIVAEYSQEPFVFVFEDDCAFVHESTQRNFDSIFSNLVLPPDFDIIYLNKFNETVPDNSGYSDSINYSFNSLKNLHPTAESYIVTPKFAKELLMCIENDIGAVDHHIMCVVEKNNKKVYTIEPSITCQANRADSDIQMWRRT